MSISASLSKQSNATGAGQKFERQVTVYTFLEPEASFNIPTGAFGYRYPGLNDRVSYLYADLNEAHLYALDKFKAEDLVT